MFRFFSTVALLVSVASCDRAEVPGKATTLVACDIFRAPTSTPLTLGVFSEGPGPSVTVQPIPYALTLVPTVVPSQWSGNASWTVETDGVYGMYVDGPVTFVVRGLQNEPLPFVHVLGAPHACDAVRRYAFIRLSVGTYSIEVGPAQLNALKLVLMPAVANDAL